MGITNGKFARRGNPKSISKKMSEAIRRQPLLGLFFKSEGTVETERIKKMMLQRYVPPTK